MHVTATVQNIKGLSKELKDAYGDKTFVLNAEVAPYVGDTVLANLSAPLTEIVDSWKVVERTVDLTRARPACHLVLEPAKYAPKKKVEPAPTEGE